MSERCATVVEQLTRLNPFAGADGLADPPRPDESAIPRQLPSLEQIAHIQKLINTLTYNHLPRTIFNLEKHRSLQSVLVTAREILTEALPIRCLEATFVALLLTQDLEDLERIPLSFKSQANGNTFRHIVMVIRARTSTGAHRYGALGLSRKQTLMYKPMTFVSLYDLVMDYCQSYVSLGHELVDIKLGVAVSHDSASRFYPCWRYVALRLSDYLDTAKQLSPPGPPAQDTVEGRNGAQPARSPPTHEPFADDLAEDDETTLAAAPDVLNTTANHTESAGGSASGAGAPAVGSIPCTARNEEERQTAMLSAAPANALDAFLRQYTTLLSTITDQLNKGIQSADSATPAVRLCYLDLDLADRNVGAENRRRVDLIARGLSPLSQDARRAAANRQLKPPGRGHTRSTARRTGGGAAVRSGGAPGAPGASSATKRRMPVAKSTAGKKSSVAATKRGTPGAKPVNDADGMSCALKASLRSAGTSAQNDTSTMFPRVPAKESVADDSVDIDDPRTNGSPSEHALSRHDSADSDIFSSFGGSDRAGDLL